MNKREKRLMETAYYKLLDVREAIKEGTWDNPDKAWATDLNTTIDDLKSALFPALIWWLKSD